MDPRSLSDRLAQEGDLQRKASSKVGEESPPSQEDTPYCYPALSEIPVLLNCFALVLLPLVLILFMNQIRKCNFTGVSGKVVFLA